MSKRLAAYRRAVRDAPELTTAEKLLLLNLAECMDYRTLGGAHPGKARLARETGVSLGSVSKLVRSVIGKGWLRRVSTGGSAKGGPRRASTYAGTIPDPAPETPGRLRSDPAPEAPGPGPDPAPEIPPDPAPEAPPPLNDDHVGTSAREPRGTHELDAEPAALSRDEDASARLTPRVIAHRGEVPDIVAALATDLTADAVAAWLDQLDPAARWQYPSQAAAACRAWAAARGNGPDPMRGLWDGPQAVTPGHRADCTCYACTYRTAPP